MEYSFEQVRELVNQGDLILFRTKVGLTRDLPNVTRDLPPSLGIVRSIEKSFITFGNSAYSLSECTYMANENNLYIVAPKVEDYVKFDLLTNLSVGVQEIVESLSHDEKFRYHNEWIRKLTPPFVLPKIKTIEYI